MNRANHVADGGRPRAPLRRQKMSDRVARLILLEIQSQGMQPGDRLPPESSMLSKWDVGRSSLREALRILEVNGIVTIKAGPGGGPLVSASDPQAFGRIWTLHLQSIGVTYRELLEARVEYEAVLARRAAESAADTADDLVRSVLASEEHVDTDDAAYAASTSGFHTLVSLAGGNKVMSLAANAIQAVWARDVTSLLFPRDGRPQVLADHMEIARAIESGDGAVAEAAMRQHLGRYQEYCEAQYARRMGDVVEWSRS